MGQKNNTYILKIASKDSIENTVIKSVKFKENHTSKVQLKKTKDSVLTIIKNLGYYSLIIINDKNKKNHHHQFLVQLGAKITSIKLSIKKDNLKSLDFIKSKIKNNKIILKGNELKQTLNSISNQLIKNGKTFSKVHLSNIKVHNSILTADFNIKKNKARTIDKIIVKGYKDFPKSYLKNYYHSNTKKTFNQNTIEQTSQKTHLLRFVKEIKKPEIQFSKDSTIMYLYLSKRKTSYFDGLINFNTENKKIKFRGYFDLKLNNTFNKGEQINLFWRNSGNNKQEIDLSAKLPYILNSKITSNFSFNLYRSDSTFTNNEVNLSFSYPYNKHIDYHLSLGNETSKKNTTNKDFNNYTKNNIGLGISYKSLRNNNLNFKIEISHNTRKTETSTNYQQLNLQFNTDFKITKKTLFSLKNKTKITNRNSTFTNELFRSGGNNSIKGFSDNSILSNSFSFINSEFRFKNTSNNILYSIHDIGVFNLNNANSILSSLGFGYEFIRKNSKVNLEYSINSSRKDLTNRSILTIKLLTFF